MDAKGGLGWRLFFMHGFGTRCEYLFMETVTLSSTFSSGVGDFPSLFFPLPFPLVVRSFTFNLHPHLHSGFLFRFVSFPSFRSGRLGLRPPLGLFT